jgi:hypothetical protein
MTREQALALQPVNILSAYSGKAGECCCGCAGKHYYARDMKDYRGGGTPKDLANIKRILAIIQCDIAEGGSDLICDIYIATEIGNSLYVAYIS